MLSTSLTFDVENPLDTTSTLRLRLSCKIYPAALKILQIFNGGNEEPTVTNARVPRAHPSQCARSSSRPKMAPEAPVMPR
jgi:hypothetical protein